MGVPLWIPLLPESHVTSQASWRRNGTVDPLPLGSRESLNSPQKGRSQSPSMPGQEGPGGFISAAIVPDTVGGPAQRCIELSPVLQELVIC